MTFRAVAHRSVPYLMVGGVGFGLGFIVVWLFVLPTSIPSFYNATQAGTQENKVSAAQPVPVASSGQGALGRSPDTANATTETTSTPQVPEIPAVIPDLAGMSLSDARPVLEGLHLQVVVQQDTSSLQPENTVLRENPVSGTQVPVGSAVTLIVSRFPSLTPAGGDSTPHDSAAAVGPH